MSARSAMLLRLLFALGSDPGKRSSASPDVDACMGGAFSISNKGSEQLKATKIMAKRPTNWFDTSGAIPKMGPGTGSTLSDVHEKIYID